MTVAELIEMLSVLPADTPVVTTRIRGFDDAVVGVVRLVRVRSEPFQDIDGVYCSVEDIWHETPIGEPFDALLVN